MPQIWKETLAPGVYITPTGVFAPTATDIDKYLNIGKAMVAAGLQIPICEEHQDEAYPMSSTEWAAAKKANSVRYNRGFVRGFRKSAAGILETLCEVNDPETFKRLPTEIKFVSPEIRRRLDGTGRDWGRCITHVALTPIPIWHTQKPFDPKDIVPGSDRFAPVGSPVKLGVRLSLSESEAPIRLSLAQLVVPQGDEWYVTRMAWQQAQSKSGGVKAFDPATKKALYGKPAERALAKQAAAAQPQAAAPAAKPKAAPAGLREGKIAPGLKVSTPKVAAKGPAKPRAQKTAPKPAKPTGPVKGLSPDEEAALDKTAAAKQALRDLPVTKGGTGDAGKGYSRKLGKVDVPAFESLAKKIDPDADLVLNGQAFTNARRAYSTWKKSFPNPAEFAEKIEAAWALDEEQVAKGKKKNAAGASYAARALAFRHMLQWADEDYAKGKDGAGSGDAGEYAERLQKPHAERLKEITSSPERQAKFIDQVGVALLRHESDYLKIPAATKSNLARIINTGSTSQEDREALKAMTKAALQNLSKHEDAYPTKSVRSILENLSNTGAGTLNPDELRNLLRDRATRKTQLSAARLSNGDTTMAEEDNDDLFTDDEIGDEDESGEETETPAVEETDEPDFLAKASEAAKELGIVVDAGQSPKDWIKHFVTAALTHKATKDKESGAGEEPPVDDSMAMQETPQVGVAMSAANLAKELSDTKLALRKREIAALVKRGKATPAQGKAWIDVLEPKRLSLASSYPESDVAKALAQIDMAKSIPAGTFMADGDVQLSAAQPVKPPDYAVDSKADKSLDTGVVNRLSGGAYAEYAKKKAGAK